VYLSGRTLFDEPYQRRRELLEEPHLSGPQ
jgi:ATP-dependent DNA ligase